MGNNQQQIISVYYVSIYIQIPYAHQQDIIFYIFMCCNFLIIFHDLLFDLPIIFHINASNILSK